MLATLRQRNFFLLWFAGLISITGNWMLDIALPVIVYQMTGSALAVGGMLLSSKIPAILFGSLAGVFVDRWERRRTIVIVNVLLALSILPLLLVRSVEWLWLVYLVGFLQSTLGQFFLPAENALLPLLSDPKLLMSANALNALNNNLARLIGPALGGFVVALTGLHGVVWIDVLTYLAAAFLAGLISVTSHPGKTEAAQPFSPGKIVHEWLEGIRLVWRDGVVRVLLVGVALISIGESIIFVLYVPFVTEVLHGDTLHVGGLMSAMAVGGIIGGLVIGWIAPRVRTTLLLGGSAVLFGLFDLALFNYYPFYPEIALAYVLIALVGPLAVWMGASFSTLMQQNVADAYRGRVSGTFALIEAIFMLIGAVVVGIAADRIGIIPVISIQGVVYVLMGALVLLALHRKSPVSPTLTLTEDTA
jgi:predicted MFS family arabinose efflux permease